MTHELNDQVQSIIENYLGRMRNHLKGLPDADREELVLEIYSHIYESYAEASTEDEVQRILQVLTPWIDHLHLARPRRRRC